MLFDKPFDVDSYVAALLQPVLYLDKSLFNKGGDGLACKKKFSNDNNGVSLAIRTKLNEIATDVRNDKLKTSDWLSIVDVLTLYSNHLDQQLFGEKLPEAEKQAMVLNYNEAAFHLSPQYDYENLGQYSPRELSTHAQLLNHLGKARRYAGVSAKERLPLLENAVKIARYLSELKCNETDDPHQYQNRLPTFELPVNYCLQDLNRFDEAANLLLPQLGLKSPFTVTQAHCQLADIYTKKYKHDNLQSSLGEALSHAVNAVEVSKAIENAPLIQFNARRCLMNVHQMAGDQAEANAIAETILSEMETNPNCGAKPDHRAAAEKVLADNKVSQSRP